MGIAGRESQNHRVAELEVFLEVINNLFRFTDEEFEPKEVSGISKSTEFVSARV